MSKLKLAPAPEETPAPTSTVVKTVGRFTFTVDTGLTVPDYIPKSAGPNDLPFREVFDDMANKGHNAHSFVPTSFWTTPKADGGRGVEAARATTPWQKEKIRGAFAAWRKKEATREKWQLVQVARVKGDMDGKIAEPGLSLFLVDSSKR